jgi:hypothetical protein
MKTFKGLQVGQLGGQAHEGIDGHLPRQTESDKTTGGAQETYRQGAQRSQEAYFSWQTNEAISIKLEDDASETTRANAVSVLTSSRVNVVS